MLGTYHNIALEMYVEKEQKLLFPL